MIDLTPTPGELLWTWRKRYRKSHAEAALALKVKPADFAAAEKGELALPGGGYLMSPDDVTAAELLRLRRRRAGVGRDALARAIGISHVTWLEWERTADPRLVAFWEEQP